MFRSATRHTTHCTSNYRRNICPIRRIHIARKLIFKLELNRNRMQMHINKNKTRCIVRNRVYAYAPHARQSTNGSKNEMKFNIYMYGVRDVI